MDIESALSSANTVMKTKVPRSRQARDELVDELDQAIGDAVEFASALTEKAEAVRDLIEELRNAELRTEYGDCVENLKAAAEELRDMLTP